MVKVIAAIFWLILGGFCLLMLFALLAHSLHWWGAVAVLIALGWVSYKLQSTSQRSRPGV
jgi:membrane protein implicated in regulation of membrane protease activity